jgi:hypothetical protein
LLTLPVRLFAQHLSGTVIDRFTKLPVAYANITVGYLSLSASITGKFILTDIKQGDVVTISSIGYKPYNFTYNTAEPDTLTVYLEQLSIVLKDVTIRSKHDAKLDSIRNRNDFASIFAYKKPTIKDIFITKSPYVYVPYNYINAPNSTASIVSVNMLSVIGLLSKNKTPESKLQKELLDDEESNYIDRTFSKQKVISITNLKGDSLHDFMDEYRPTLKQVKKMNDYELGLYIRKSYAEFIKTYKHQDWSMFAR